MADNLKVQLRGVEDLKRALRQSPAKIRAKAVRRALTLAGRVIRDEAKARAPLLQMPTPYRTRGTVKRRIAVRPSRFARQAGDEGVFVGVRPIRGRAQIARYGRAGARNPNDPYYWRFLEFGTRKMAARPFLGPAARTRGEQAIALFMERAVPLIESLNRRPS